MTNHQFYPDGHIVDMTRGVDKRNPGQFHNDTVVSLVKPSRRRLNIMSALATGWLPWGVRWDQNGVIMPLCGNQYTLCCGHTMGAKELQIFVDDGLIEAAQPVETDKRPHIAITEAGRRWLSRNWK